MKKRNYKLIVNRLRPLVLNNDMDGLSEIFEEFTLENILNKEFINYCRNSNELSLVIFICTLYLQNVSDDSYISKVLDCYRFLQSKDSIYFSEFKDKRYFLASVCQTIIEKEESINCNEIRMPIAECLLCIELALDFDNLKLAIFLLENFADKLKKNRGYIKLAIYLSNRNSSITQERHKDWKSVLYFYDVVLDKVKNEKLIQLNSKLSLALTQVCLVSKNHNHIFKYEKFVSGDEDFAAMKFQLAIASCFLNRFAESIVHLDALIGNLLRQSDDFIRHKFSSQVANNDQTNKELSTQGIAIALDHLQKLLGKENKKIFLVSGTLLGYAREKSVLSHDKDVDVGIFFHEDIESTINTLKNDSAFFVKMFHAEGGNIYSIGLIHKSTNSPIDIFIYHLEEGKLVTGVEHAFGYLQKFAFSPFELKPVTFLDIPIYIPENYELNLSENFGAWKIPDKNYISHLESPSTVDKGGLIYMIVLRLELMKSIRELNLGKMDKIIKINNQLIESKFSIPTNLILKVKKRWLPELATA